MKEDMTPREVIVTAVIAVIAILTSFASYHAGKYVGTLETMNAMYKVANEQLQAQVGNKIAIVNALEKGGKK